MSACQLRELTRTPPKGVEVTIVRQLRELTTRQAVLAATVTKVTKTAQASVRDGDATVGVCRADTRTDIERRDDERLDANPYWSPVPVDGIGESSDECVEVDVASSHGLDTLRKGPVRWMHRTDIHPFRD
ncbi:hypothetical protein PPTG_20374 [Phytophthora nicotianae INRA-310]|uniref:Uncharacterized protein n=1 Tax=Phytophthora nicotianae (strain INRA-310) TaxID=761204 RepID=W2P914_PHYN3|nr:hypothetical protein PPTG_20374 [Phytophthora nicotianae INRA-310]ETM97517.1 hypothetical protein PPTG_20374 [Phytophthora nicotianae INRA-310]